MGIRLSSSHHHRAKRTAIYSARKLRAGREALAEFRLGPARLMRAYGVLPAKSPDACATTVTRAAQNALVIK
jgi:hypothetical protein